MGPLVAVPGGGQFRTVIYYGPWQCRRDFMEGCRAQCAGSGHVLMGCMWLADVKMDFEGTVLQTGSRFAVRHCCCNYAPKTTAQTATLRQRWDAIRESFRKDWGKRFGEWPADSQGNAWPCHHLRDLKHGGSPTDWENLFPLPPEIHSTLGGLYNQCYAGSGPWSSAGPDYPYGE